MEKVVPKLATLVILEHPPKTNYHPIGENSPNLFTLMASLRADNISSKS
jgi:hypothetical protein